MEFEASQGLVRLFELTLKEKLKYLPKPKKAEGVSQVVAFAPKAPSRDERLHGFKGVDFYKRKLSEKAKKDSIVGQLFTDCCEVEEWVVVVEASAVSKIRVGDEIIFLISERSILGTVG